MPDYRMTVRFSIWRVNYQHIEALAMAAKRHVGS